MSDMTGSDGAGLGFTRFFRDPKMLAVIAGFVTLVIPVFVVVVINTNKTPAHVQQASSTTLATLETENMTWSTPNIATVITDSTASGGKAVKLTNTVTGSMSTTTTASSQQLVLAARGDQCNGAPHMQVKLDGVVVGNQDVTATSWTNYSFPAAVPAGTHKIEVTFTNPYTGYFWFFVSCVRALYVDKTDVVTATSSTTTTTTTPTSTVSLNGGYATHIMYQTNPGAYVKLAADGGAKYVRDDISWAQLEYTKGSYNWSYADLTIGTAAKHGLRVLMLADTSPQWASGSTNPWAPPQNAADYANFITQIVKRYGTNGTYWTANPTVPKLVPAGIEVWNEPNISGFWGGKTPDPVKYAAMLKAAYPAAKAVDPSIPVLTAGIGPEAGYNDINCDGVPDSGMNSVEYTGLNYFEAIYKNGIHGYFDAVAWHPYIYGRPTAVEMMQKSDCGSGWTQMADSNPSVRSFMTQYGDSAKKIWVTETGAPTCITGATYPCLSETEQDNLAALQTSQFKTYSWGGLFFWYDLNDDSGGTSTSDWQQHFGAVHADGSVKPVYNYLKAAFGA